MVNYLLNNIQRSKAKLEKMKSSIDLNIRERQFIGMKTKKIGWKSLLFKIIRFLVSKN